MSFARKSFVAAFCVYFWVPNLFSQPIAYDSDETLVNLVFYDKFRSLTVTSGWFL